MQLHLTTKQDLHTPLFRLRVLLAVLAVLTGYAVSAFFPHVSFGMFIVLLMFLLPGGDYPMDLSGATWGPMLIAVSTGPELAKYSLTFDLGFVTVSSAVLGAMGFFLARWFVRDWMRHESKATGDKSGS